LIECVKSEFRISAARFFPILKPPMSTMRKTRELAMQALFLWDANANLDLALGAQATRDEKTEEAVAIRALQMAEGAWNQRESIDALIERIAPQWPPRRQPAVDRSILRLAVWELNNQPTPPKVVIDEAIELAKEFSTEQSPAFVNGVLDAVLREKSVADHLANES
jgi:N utilization substance protein B